MFRMLIVQKIQHYNLSFFYLSFIIDLFTFMRSESGRSTRTRNSSHIQIRQNNI